MVQVIGSGGTKKGIGQLLGEGLGAGLGSGVSQGASFLQQLGLQKMQGRQQMANELMKHQMEMQSLPAKYKAQYGAKADAQRELMRDLGLDLSGQQTGGGPETPGMAQEMPQERETSSKPKLIPQDKIAAMAMVNPAVADKWQKFNEQAVAQQRHEEKRSFEREKFDTKQQQEERAYQSSYSKEAEKKANAIREILPKKEMSLDMARNAIESADLSFFSPDKLADVTGIDLFRTAKGSQLATASKENLLSNMGRVSAKGQNIWFEQRLNSMFPKIGQSKEANMTVQEMLEGETQMDRAYLNEFDRLSADDEAKYGFVRKDIEKRARDAVKPIEKEIMKRTSYRMKEIEEQEGGLQSIKGKVGKNVVKGTPLTLAMAKLYKQKFGENALDVAEKNGYYIPTIEEFQAIRATPQEFRETATQ